MGDDKSFGRRAFFRQGLRQLLRPVDTAIAPMQRAAAEIAKLEPPAGTRCATTNGASVDHPIGHASGREDLATEAHG